MSDTSAAAAPKTAQFQEEILLLAEKLGELNDRFGRIETEFASQAAPLDASQKALESTVTALNAALTGIKALNFHVLDNNLGAVSSRVTELSKQTDIALRALDAKVDEHQRALATAESETAKKFSAQDEARVELARKRDEQARDFAQQVENVRAEFSRHLATIADDVKKFATPASFNPRGSWDALTSYSRLDIAELNGSSYVSIVDGNTEKPGKNSRTWTLLARRGGSASGGGGISDITGIAGFTPIGLQIAQASDASSARTIIGVADMVGATASVNGAAGRVPQPAAGDQSKFLRGDGTFAMPAVVTASAATNAQAIAGTATDVYNTPASGNARALYGDLTRRISDVLASDGATSNRRAEWTFGAAGAVAGLPISFPFEFRVPKSNPSAVTRIAYMGSQSTPTALGVWDLSFTLTTAGALSISVRGADSTADARILTHSTFRATYSGQWVRGMVVFEQGNSATSPKIYAQGVDISASFALTYGSGGAGTAPNWMASSLDTTKYLVGFNWPLGRLVPHAPILGALTAAEVLEWAQTGRLPIWCDVSAGSAVAIISPTVLNGGFETLGSGGADVFANWTEFASGASTLSAETTDVYAGVYSLKMVVDASNNNVNFFQNNLLRIGHRYRLTFFAKSDGGGRIGSDSVAGAGDITGNLTTTWTEYVVDFDAVSSALVLKRGSSSTGRTILVDNITLRALGPIAKPVVQPIAVLADAGANKLAGVITSGITPITDRRDWVIQAQTSTSGNQQILGAAVFMNANSNRLDSWVINNAGTSKTVSLGNTSGGTAYANGITAGAGLSDTTLATRFNATVNLWVNSNGTDVLTHTINGRRVD